MPGRGCLARKAARRAERDKQLLEEGLLPPSKLRRVVGEDGTLPTGESLERTWVEAPPLSELSAEDREKAMTLCCALWEATKEYGDGQVTVSQLGSHFKVAAAKKEPCFNHMRLVDLIKRHPEVFELIEQSGTVTGGWVVKFQPGAAEIKPDGTPASTGEEEVDLDLPERIEEPTTVEMQLQALRIEVVYALCKRSMKAMLHDLGQEPKILKHKTGALQNRRLLEMIKAFPWNFAVEDVGNGNFSIELSSTDVTDTSMIEECLSRPAREGDSRPHEDKGGAKGKGKMMKGCKGKGKMMDMMYAMMMNKGPMAMKGMMAQGMMAAMMGKGGGGKGKWGGMEDSWGSGDYSWDGGSWGGGCWNGGGGGAGAFDSWGEMEGAKPGKNGKGKGKIGKMGFNGVNSDWLR